MTVAGGAIKTGPQAGGETPASPATVMARELLQGSPAIPHKALV